MTDLNSAKRIHQTSTCKHGTKATRHAVHGLDFYGREQVEYVEAIECEQCKQELLDLLKGVTCDKCNDGEFQIHDDAWAKCDKCGHTCDLGELEYLSKRTEKSRAWSEIRECYLEDVRRGSRAGGSGDKGPKKEDKLGSRSLRQVTWTEDEGKVLGQSSLEPKARMRSIKGLPEGITGDQVRQAAARKLGLDEA